MHITAPPATPSPATPAAAPTASATARATATKFEALIVGEMLKAMRSAKIDSGLFDSDAEGHWSQMRDQQFAQALAARSPIGVAAHLTSPAK